jgi:hypothetical protein
MGRGGSYCLSACRCRLVLVYFALKCFVCTCRCLVYFISGVLISGVFQSCISRGLPRLRVPVSNAEPACVDCTALNVACATWVLEFMALMRE